MSENTPDSLIPYDEIVQEALRAVVGRVLGEVESTGRLPGAQHFYLTLHTPPPPRRPPPPTSHRAPRGGRAGAGRGRIHRAAARRASFLHHLQDRRGRSRHSAPSVRAVP